MDALLISKELKKLGVTYLFLDDEVRSWALTIEDSRCVGPTSDLIDRSSLVILASTKEHQRQKDKLLRLGYLEDTIVFDEWHRLEVLKNEELVGYLRQIGLEWSFSDEQADATDLLQRKSTPFFGSQSGKVFDGYSYSKWRKTRLRKLYSILDQLNFGLSNSNVIEFGCGHGQVSRHLASRQMKVMACEGNSVNVEITRGRLRGKKNITVIHHDNDTDWSVHFNENSVDLIVHGGLSYHLLNWERDLRTCCRTAKIVCLESEVNDTESEGEGERREFGFDQSLHGCARVPTATAIESIFTECGMHFARYDDPDLNTHLDWGLFLYDWVPGSVGCGSEKEVRRRFWVAHSSNLGTSVNSHADCSGGP